MYNNFNKFLKDWNNSEYIFEIKTSGSTGTPKLMTLDRKLLRLSANQTSNAIEGINTQPIFCCLPTDKMGGFMQLVRAAIWQVPCTVIKPTNNPLINFKEKAAGSISLSPMQLYNILLESESKINLAKFDTILVGGASISVVLHAMLEDFEHASLYFTYGMTETYSHIALRKHPHLYFQLIDGYEKRLTEQNSLAIKGAITQNKWLDTGDVVNFVEGNKFEIIGRIDNIINSGGVKYSAEQLEQVIAKLYNKPFYISSIKDAVLGQKIALIVEDAIDVDLNLLNNSLKTALGSNAKIRTIIENKIDINLVTGKVLRRKIII